MTQHAQQKFYVLMGHKIAIMALVRKELTAEVLATHAKSTLLSLSHNMVYQRKAHLTLLFQQIMMQPANTALVFLCFMIT